VPKDCVQLLTIRAAKKRSKTSHLIAFIILQSKEARLYIEAVYILLQILN
jgi:hypothetical protein